MTRALSTAPILLVAGNWPGVQLAKGQSAAEQLSIKVEEGAGTPHRPGDKGTAIKVKVLNEQEVEQPGAFVAFTAPPLAPPCLPGGKPAKASTAPQQKCPASVLLGPDKTNLRVQTGSDGVAEVNGVVGNNIKGSVQIKVVALFQDKVGSATVTHFNQNPPFWNKKHVGIIAGILGTTGIILYEAFKPGPPSASINSAVSSTSQPQSAGSTTLFRFGR